AFEFTTQNQDYSCLAWQKDANDSVKQAEEGMARTFHDLGVWSSLGVLHSSTAALFHNFAGNRIEILLPELFTAFDSAITAFPGSLSYWDTKATEQSDWGFTGLRDIGDAEFYGTISMHSWKDSSWQFPTFSQRAAFVNIACSNLMAGLLHYMRLHKTSTDWYYRNQASCQRLADWI
ncbi:hypothetical protein, partial [Sansalvadorimonas verongulae]|uniref:hypothetical protein n=1 Tax=Sansalvadorimonas verongulae TaxID=2172824 RepID=UPI0018AD1D9B